MRNLYAIIAVLYHQSSFRFIHILKKFLHAFPLKLCSAFFFSLGLLVKNSLFLNYLKRIFISFLLMDIFVGYEVLMWQLLSFSILNTFHCVVTSITMRSYLSLLLLIWRLSGVKFLTFVSFVFIIFILWFSIYIYMYYTLMHIYNIQICNTYIHIIYIYTYMHIYMHLSSLVVVVILEFVVWCLSFIWKVLCQHLIKYCSCNIFCLQSFWKFSNLHVMPFHWILYVFFYCFLYYRPLLQP